MEPIRVVAGVLVREGRVLAARRGAQQHQALRWEFPGGKVESGETDAVALARELYEEFQVRVAVGEQVGVSRYRYPHVSIVLVALRCVLLDGELRPTEHAEICWADGARLLDLDFAEADRPLLGAVAQLLTD